MGLNYFAILVCFIKCIVMFAEELLNMMLFKGTTFIWNHLARNCIVANVLLILVPPFRECIGNRGQPAVMFSEAALDTVVKCQGG